MKDIKEWGLLLLFVCAGTLIYCFLLPSGNVSKTVKSVVSVLVLSSVCAPLINVFESSGIKLEGAEDVPEIPDIADFYIDSARMTVDGIIADTVKNFTRVSYKTDIIIDKTEDGSINIGYIGIIFSAGPQKEKELREALFSALGVMPDIRVEYAQ